MFEGSESVDLWINGYQSEKMRQMYLKHLKSYCDFHGKGPEELLGVKRSQGSEPVAEKMLDRFVVGWGRPESVKKTAVAVIRSFYRSNYLDLASRAGSQTHYTRVKPIRVPTQDELRELCLGRNIRDIALVNVLSSSGFREGTLSMLTWGHVEELDDWDGQGPVHVGIMGRELKGGGSGRYANVEQHAFLTPHAAEILGKYRAWRESREESITSDSPLFATVDMNLKRLSTRQVRRILERSCEGKSFRFSPHDLRRFTQTQLEAARVQPNWIRKMLGKKVRGEEAPYSRPKIEQLRDAYRSALPFLTLAPETDEARVWKTQARQNLEMLTKLGVMPQSEFNRLQEWLMRSSNPDQFYSEIKPVSGEFKRLNEQLDNGTHQVVDNEDIMLELLNDGWELVRELNGSKFLMKKP